MRLQDLTAAQPAQFSDGSQEQTFGFGMSDPKVIFTILRERMYSNPHKAAIQEYMCNARDAHREAGIDERPIEVTFPGFDGSEIYIRDFGLGIPRDKMETVFCKYGASTKRTSDRFTGGWGLGCKTGFAVGDSFSVMSITVDADGVRRKRSYLAYLDDTAGGSMSLLSEEETDEETGVQIQLPVDSSRLGEYAEYVEATGKFWKVKPLFKNYPGFDGWDEPDYYVRGDRWAMQKGGYYSHAYLVLDGIQYRFRSEIFNGIDLSESVQSMAKKPFVLFFETGELTPTPNREDISYDEDSKFLIAERLEEISRTFYDTMKSEVDALLDADMHPLDLEVEYSKRRSDLEMFAPDLAKRVVKSFFMRDRLHGTDNNLQLWSCSVTRSTWRENEIGIPRLLNQMAARRDRLYVFDDSLTQKPNRARVNGMFHEILENPELNDGQFNKEEFEEIYIVRPLTANSIEQLKKNHPHYYSLFISRPLSSFKLKHISGGSIRKIRKPKPTGIEVRALNRDLVPSAGLYGAFVPFDFKSCERKPIFKPATSDGYDEYETPHAGRTVLESIQHGIFVVLKNGQVYSPEDKSYLETIIGKIRGKVTEKKVVEFPDDIKVGNGMIALLPERIPLFGVFEKGWQAIRNKPGMVPLKTYLYNRLQQILRDCLPFYDNGTFYIPNYAPCNLNQIGTTIVPSEFTRYMRSVNPSIVPWHSYRDALKFHASYPKAFAQAQEAVRIGSILGTHFEVTTTEFTVPDDNRIIWFASALVHGKMTEEQKKQFLSLLRTTKMKKTA